MKKLLLILFLIIGMGAATVKADEYDLAAKSAIAVDASSGKILYEKNSTTPIEVGSITHLLTAYLVYEAISEGKLSLDTDVDISDYAYNLTANPYITNLPLEARRYTVEELLEASLLISANSATIALAEKVAGSEENFVKMMKDKLKEWKITDAIILNATGTDTRLLDGTIDENNTVDSTESTEISEKKSKDKKDKDTENKFSAYALAVVTYHLLKDYPQIIDITSKPKGNFAGIELGNYNLMLEGLPSFRSGVDGLKTGGSEKGGASFVATTTEKGVRLITVVLGVEQEANDPYIRFSLTSSLMSYVSQNFVQTVLVQKGEAYKSSQVNIKDGKQNTEVAVASEDFVIIERIGNQAEAKLKFSAEHPEFQAPMKKGTEIGTLTYIDPEPIGQGYLENKQPSISMVTGKKVEKAIFFKVWWNDFVRFVNEKL
ncbi:D-alanyl-D-alanine carboxypeptidase PBP3 [Streptococcus sp. DD04]|uniref:D-alanyl-D-alanine carboxypeptidase PBP3 n=1 Tax=Streptococcus sp. DD04 TaxID=1776578 RepID=UPI0007826D0E|nr:D-alanyl-D-alanine carboxypeptidase PBP3 [Streptococcus sp. DD04]KXT64222.1 D-alanyl-D-alanine carboxypeptidase [Streptococcus sp. DD04]